MDLFVGALMLVLVVGWLAGAGWLAAGIGRGIRLRDEREVVRA